MFNEVAVNSVKIGAASFWQIDYHLGMDVEQLKQDAREGRVDVGRLVDMIVALQNLNRQQAAILPKTHCF